MSHRTAAALAAATLAFTLTACGGGGSDDDYQGVCVDPQTQVRLDDDACGDHDDGHHSWVFYPAVGSHATGYTKSVPKGSRYSHGGATKAGGGMSAPTKPASSPKVSYRSGRTTGSNSKPSSSSGTKSFRSGRK